MRVRACFLCKEYVILHNGNPISQSKEAAFMNFHTKHPTQLVNEETFQTLKESGYKEFKVFYGGIEI